MINDEQRREVAQRMRNEIHFMRLDREWYEAESNVVECGNRAFRNIAHSVIPFSYLGNDYIGIVERLADLIDRPKCNNVSEFGSHAVTRGDAFKDEEFDFVCSRCGIHLMGDEMDSSPLLDGKLEHHALSFCPNCGAEIVE